MKSPRGFSNEVSHLRSPTSCAPSATAPPAAAPIVLGRPRFLLGHDHVDHHPWGQAPPFPVSVAPAVSAVVVCALQASLVVGQQCECSVAFIQHDAAERSGAD